MRSPFSRAARVLRHPTRIADYVSRYLTNVRFRKLVLESRPIPLARESEVEVHTLFGCRNLIEAIAALKSLYRFASTGYSLVVHDDGTLMANDARLLRHHFPGVRIIPRAKADREVTDYLRRQGLTRCLELREQFVLALKFFDLPFYGVGRRILYMDSDILFLREPAELLQVLQQPLSEWRDRFNLDIHNCYSWDTFDLERLLGIPILRFVNSGLLVLFRNALDWSAAESCLTLPTAPNSRHYIEQTLFAVELSRRDARPLPPEYDVCFRNTWREDYDRWVTRADTGYHAISQHYCGSPIQRAHFYRHFVRFIAPNLA